MTAALEGGEWSAARSGKDPVLKLVKLLSLMQYFPRMYQNIQFCYAVKAVSVRERVVTGDIWFEARAQIRSAGS